MVILSDGTISMAELFSDVEDCAEELAEAVRRCSPERHDHHGQEHSEEDAREAFKAGVNQLLTRDFAQEWEELNQKIEQYKRWGGQVPAAVLQPASNGKDWEAVVPGKDGTPQIYDMSSDVLGGIMPLPHEAGAMPNPDGPGWVVGSD
jgi:hypothetical protein